MGVRARVARAREVRARVESTLEKMSMCGVAKVKAGVEVRFRMEREGTRVFERGCAWLTAAACGLWTTAARRAGAGSAP